MNDKRIRGSNFSSAECQLLLTVAKEKHNILENKLTNGAIWKAKIDAWDKIAHTFNGSTTGEPRDSKSLRKKYESLKTELRKRISNNKAYVPGTGAGPYKSSHLTPVEEQLTAKHSSATKFETVAEAKLELIEQRKAFIKRKEEWAEQKHKMDVEKYKIDAERAEQNHKANAERAEEKHRLEVLALKLKIELLEKKLTSRTFSILLR